MVLTYKAAAQAGVLDALPGTLSDLAARCAVENAGLRPVLSRLAAWGIVAQDGDRYIAGPRAPVPPGDAMLLTYVAAIHRWAALLGPRLRDRTASSAESGAQPEPGAARLLTRPDRAIASLDIRECAYQHVAL